MNATKTLTLALAAAATLLLAGCGSLATDMAMTVLNKDAIKGDLPESMQAHLKEHPGDIRFNRPKLVWKVLKDHDFGPDWHVLPDEVYLRIYQNKFDEVWDTMQLDQGTGKAYDVVVRVPILYQFPGRPMHYYTAGWSYEAEVVDPDTGETIAHWDAGHSRSGRAVLGRVRAGQPFLSGNGASTSCSDGGPLGDRAPARGQGGRLHQLRGGGGHLCALQQAAGNDARIQLASATGGLIPKNT